MKEKGTNPLVDALWQASKAVRLEVNDPENNLDIARKHLESGSLLLYANHFSILDTTVVAKFIEQELSLNNLSIFAGRKHFDPKRGRFSQFKKAVILPFAEMKGFNLLQVVQENEKELYEDWKKFNFSSTRKATEAVRTTGKILAIAPEGTRSRTGGLLNAVDGIEDLFKLGKDKVLALPIAMHPYKIVPPFTKTIIEVGKPFTYREIEMEHALSSDTSITDLMMKRLAILLPVEYRGAYR